MSLSSAARSRKPLDAAVVTALALGLVTVGAAGLLLSAFSGLGLVTLAGVQEDRAADLLDRTPVTPRARVASEAAARQALARSPTRAAGWLELAYADSLKPQGLGASGIQALQRSYDFEPLGPDVSEWRLAFAFEHWDQLTPEIRAAALNELEARWKREERRKALNELPDRIANPAGRVAAALTLRRLRRGG